MKSDFKEEEGFVKVGIKSLACMHFTRDTAFVVKKNDHH